MASAGTLLESAYKWESTAPDRVFMTQPLGGDNVVDWTWARTMDEARRMASYLVSLNLPARSQVAICSKNCAWWVVADLAIWMAGHVTVPVFPTLTPDIVRYILEHSESKLLFVGKLDPIWDTMKPGVPEGLPCVAFPVAPAGNGLAWDELVAKHAPLATPVEREPGEMATIIYTSGSTGMPKGVMQSFGAMYACSVGLHKLLHWVPGDRYLSYLPIAHGMERWLGECMGLYNGHRVYFAESLETFVADLRRARPTLFLSVPRLWLKFQRGVYDKMPKEKLDRLLRIPILRSIVKKKILKQLGLDQVRFAGSGSAPLPAELIAWYRSLGLELLEGYGMTENFNYSHLCRPGLVRPGYVGQPYDEVQCRIADNGEIQIKSPGVMMGYFKMPAETAEVLLADGFQCTGDRGETDEQNRLKITGRTKEIFKTSKGKYIAPAPLENRVVNHPHIELCCVSGAGHPQPHAVIQLSDTARKMIKAGERATVEKDLVAHVEALNVDLVPHEKIAFLAVMKELWAPENGFLTPTMKIRRPRIEDAVKPKLEGWYASGKVVIWPD